MFAWLHLCGECLCSVKGLHLGASYSTLFTGRCLFLSVFQKIKTMMHIFHTPKWTLISGARRPGRRSASPWKFYPMCWKNIMVTNSSSQIETSFQQAVRAQTVCVLTCWQWGKACKRVYRTFAFSAYVMLLQCLAHRCALCLVYTCCFVARLQFCFSMSHVVCL